ncbi:alpha/beta hydrolase [Bradyrhizobium sp. Ash2021]|uniref:alpha/beta fold hydrolase n=1 Tax=Bradyrhizobium sp. Ash2021 TaxID=2954771 RepID=UPI00281672A2|nr:alpha/beta hydrolase [Bradyrhizobium sp. Ash2021]WMT76326.1 alpha/beta hydrolase [Bradyrhizobium sp. Ash2021]
MYSLKHGTLAVNGVRLHYVEQGAGAPILFLHGFPEYWGAWRTIMKELGDQFRSIAIDTRGINLSGEPEGLDGYAVKELVEDVVQTIAALGCKKVTLVGHDWGGFIAWEMAIRHPEMLDRLVIINTAHTGIFDRELRKGEAQAAASKYMLAFRSPRGEELVSRKDFAGFRREIIDPHRASGTMTEEEAAEYIALWNNAGSLTAGLNYYRANKSGPPSGDDNEPRSLPDTVISVPTLVIWGEKDVYFTPDNADLLQEVVPDLTVRRFAENDHWIVHQKPKEVAALIAQFALGRLAVEHAR